MPGAAHKEPGRTVNAPGMAPESEIPMQRQISRERVERNIYRRTDAAGRVRFELNYRDSDGKARRQTIEGGIKAARAALADVKARQGKGERVAPRRLRFDEAAERWLTSAQATLRPATGRTYDAHLRVHLLPRWRSRRLDSIGVDDVARLVEEMRAAGCKAWTIRGALTVAGRVFDFARRRLDCPGANPVRDLDRSERPASDARERRVLTRDELAAVLAAAPDRHRPLLRFAAQTGVRLGEALGLRWRDINLDEGTATIAGQLDRDRQHVECKTRRSRRTLELPGELTHALREHRLAASRCAPDDAVFSTRTGGPFDHRAVQRALRSASTAAGIADPPPTVHDLRHTHASAWIAAGGDLAELSARLGHASPAITASVYAHDFEAVARGAERRARLDVMYGSAVAATDRSPAQRETPPVGAEVADLQARRDAAQ